MAREHTPNRRHVLAGLLAAPAAITASQVTAETMWPVPATSHLDRLIREHEAKYAAWEALFDANDLLPDERGPTYEADKVRESAAEAEERSALASLLSYRPASMEEVQRRLAYLLRGIWRGTHMEDWEATLFLASLMPEGWEARHEG